MGEGGEREVYRSVRGKEQVLNTEVHTYDEDDVKEMLSDLEVTTIEGEVVMFKGGTLQ